MQYHIMAPSLFLALFLSIGAYVYSASNRVVQVSDVCSKHPNPTNCAYILYTIAGTEAGIELPGSIPRYIITDIGHTSAFDVNTLINTLIRNASDPQLKQRYISCSNDYVDAVGYFDSAKSAYAASDYNGMKSNVANVIKAIQDCDWRPPYDPSALPLLNKFMQDVSSIIMILAEFMLGTSTIDKY